MLLKMRLAREPSVDRDSEPSRGCSYGWYPVVTRSMITILIAVLVEIPTAVRLLAVWYLMRYRT